MDKETLPQWGWLLAGLFGAAFVAGVVNAALLFPTGLPERYGVVTTIALMAPVLVFVGIWHDEDRQSYWDRSRTWMVADLAFVVAGATLGASAVLIALEGISLYWIFDEILAMLGGFLLGWALFWWRNTDVYVDDERRSR